MKKFNLHKHHLDDVISYTRQELRENYTWWDYDQLRGGGDSDWNRYVNIDRSLMSALQDAGVDRQSRLRKLQAWYGIPPSELFKIFKTYVGYHPAYGAYICHIGPYMGSKFPEANDKFSFYVKRVRKSTQESIAKSLDFNIAKYMDTYGVDLDPSDIQFVLKEPGVFDPRKTRQEKVVTEVITNMDPESAEAQDFYERAPIAPAGSEFGLNAKGLEKLIRNKWGTFYQETIAEKAAEEGITQREVINMELRDLDFLKRVYQRVTQKYQIALESGEASISGMMAPPAFVDLSLKGVSGQEQFTTVTRNSLLKGRLNLRKEILELLNQGITDPQEITSSLNSRAKRNTNPIPLSEVEDRLQKISELSNTAGTPEASPLTHETLINNTSAEISNLQEAKGFEDLKTAFGMAKVYFTNLPVDPLSKSKMQVQYAPKMVFDPPEHFENISSEDLLRFREEKQANDAREAGQATEEQIREEIGEDMPPNIEQEVEDVGDGEPIPDEEATPETPPTPYSALDIGVPNQMIENLFGGTLDNLIKLAEELDGEDKGPASEEIHKVIRKYQERI